MNSGSLDVWLRALFLGFLFWVVGWLVIFFFFLEMGVVCFFLSFFLNVVTILLQVSESIIAIGLITLSHPTGLSCQRKPSLNNRLVLQQLAVCVCKIP